MRRMAAHLRTLRSLPPRRFDALLALLVAAETSAESLLCAPLEGRGWLAGLATVWVMAFGVYLRRQVPFVAIGLALGGFLIADQLGDDMIGHMAGPFFAVLLVTYSAGTVLEGRRLAAAAAWATTLLIISLNPAESETPVANAIFSTVFVVAAPMLFGQLMTNR